MLEHTSCLRNCYTLGMYHLICLVILAIADRGGGVISFLSESTGATNDEYHGEYDGEHRRCHEVTIVVAGGAVFIVEF